MKAATSRFSRPLIVLAILAGILALPALGTPAWTDDGERRSSSGLKSTRKQSTIVFASTRYNPTGPIVSLDVAEIYLMDLVEDVDGKPLLVQERRLTVNSDRDALPALSPDGKGKIVFDSNRLRKLASPPEPNSSDLFLMQQDGSDQRFLARGSSADWSPDGKRIVFHRSASDTFVPPVGNPSPGAPTDDSDIFVLKLHRGAPGQNLTFEEPDDRLYINEDADWSPDGKRIAFARRGVLDNSFPSNSGDIWVMNADGTNKTQLTGLQAGTEFEDKSPAWSLDGKLIAYSCRPGPASVPAQNPPDICVIQADGSNPVPTRLTEAPQGELGPHWLPSPDGEGDKIVYQRPLPVPGITGPRLQQIWLMNADGTDQTQLTFAADGTSQFPNWGEIKSR